MPEIITSTQGVHNCPVHDDAEAAVVTLIGYIPTLDQISEWGFWCPFCGVVWQGGEALTEPMSPTEVYALNIRAYGPDVSVN